MGVLKYTIMMSSSLLDTCEPVDVSLEVICKYDSIASKTFKGLKAGRTYIDHGSLSEEYGHAYELAMASMVYVHNTQLKYCFFDVIKIENLGTREKYIFNVHDTIGSSYKDVQPEAGKYL